MAALTEVAEEDLPFQKGDLITIIQACEIMFWYIGKDSQGRTGAVPRNFLEPIDEGHNDQVSSEPPPTPSNVGWERQQTSKRGGGEAYLDMHPINSSPTFTTKQPEAETASKPQQMDVLDVEMLLIQDKEKRRRLRAGTLVMGNCPFPGDQPGDLPFNVYDEMSILYPMPDLCWYFAQKTDKPERKGAIPITHVRLVYMSDDEDDEGLYKAPSKPAHDRLYDDVNEFLSQSGWFSFPGLAHGKQALQHVLAKKMKLSHKTFLGIREAVYLFEYRQGEKLLFKSSDYSRVVWRLIKEIWYTNDHKCQVFTVPTKESGLLYLGQNGHMVYVGKAKVLHEDICKHFECFAKKRDEICEIDDELCHHTDSSGWEITVWPVQPDQDLEVEWAKKIVEHKALTSKEETGLNEDMEFSSTTAFDKFWDWFSPN